MFTRTDSNSRREKSTGKSELDSIAVLPTADMLKQVCSWFVAQGLPGLVLVRILGACANVIAASCSGLFVFKLVVTIRSYYTAYATHAFRQPQEFGYLSCNFHIFVIFITNKRLTTLAFPVPGERVQGALIATLNPRID